MISEKKKRILEIEEKISELDRSEWMINVQTDILSWQDREKLDEIRRERRQLIGELDVMKNEKGS